MRQEIENFTSCVGCSAEFEKEFKGVPFCPPCYEERLNQGCKDILRIRKLAYFARFPFLVDMNKLHAEAARLKREVYG